MKQTAQQLLSKAQDAREKGEFVTSLAFLDEALLVFDKDKNVTALAESLASRSVALRVWSGLEERTCLLRIAKNELLAGVTIAEKSKDTRVQYLVYYHLAQVQEDLGEWQDALLSYEKAQKLLENLPNFSDKKAELATLAIHYFVCTYKTGHKNVLKDVFSALKQLQHATLDSYAKAVWISGGYLRLAEILQEDNPEQAKEYLAKAKEIIFSDTRLILRKRQWEKLAKEMK